MKQTIVEARPELTPIQANVVAFIRSFSATNGYPPTGQEINDHFGWNSPNAAAQHIRLIERKGYIRRTPGIARGLVLL